MYKLEDYPTKTCLIYKDGKLLYTSEKRGVAPLLDFYHEHGTVQGITVVDRIIGKAAAMLAILCGATTIYTPIISIDALQFFKRSTIELHYEQEVPFIINRDQTGRCPVESSVLNITDIQEAYRTIIATLKTLSST